MINTTINDSNNEFMNENPQPAVPPKRIFTRKTKRLIFYISTVAWFIINLAVFFFYINVDNLLMAFRIYSEATDGYGYVYKYVLWDNFKHVADIIFVPQKENNYMFTASVLVYVISLCVTMPLSLLFSFYIYKKFLFSEFFRVILFMPTVVSSVILVTIYKFIVTDMYAGMSGEASLLSPTRTDFQRIMVIVVYTLWHGFGMNILMYSSAMSGINESIVESCQLDGCNIVQEFFHITMPGIWGTFTTFIVMGMSHIFNNQMSLYTFFERDAIAQAGFQTLGYYVYIKTLESPGLVNPDRPQELTTPQLAALGLIIGAMTLPIVLGGKKLMEKFGPSSN